MSGKSTSTMWTVKHRPNRLSEVVGNREAKDKLIKWIKEWEHNPPPKRAILIYGPPGIGKTAAAEAAALNLGYDLIEMNASNQRTAEIVERIAGTASREATLPGTRRRLILLDEIDGISGREDKGGVGAIIKIIKKTQCPIILVANNPWTRRFQNIRRYTFLIKFDRLSTNEVVSYLLKICKKEGIKVDYDALKFIAEKSEGDLRSAINDLQTLSQGWKRLAYKDVIWLTGRNRKVDIFSILRDQIFTAKTCIKAKKAVDMTDVDYKTLLEWIYENAPRELRDPEDLVRAMDAIAKADIYLNRVKNTQNWGLLTYVFDMMTAGVAMSRKKSPHSWTRYEFPRRIKRLAKTKKIRRLKTDIGIKIRKKCHTSAATAARDYLPYIKLIFENNPKMATRLAKWFDFDESMIEYLARKDVFKRNYDIV